MASIKTGTFRDAQDAFEQLGIGQPPPSGLVPIGDSGLYTTPDTPASVFDCDRYPDSLYCGGNPLSATPVGFDVSTTVQVNDCGITRSISVTPILGFIKLPPVTAAHIPENCREQYEVDSKRQPPKPPPGQRDDYQPTPQFAPQGFEPDDIVCVVTIDQFFRESQDYFPESDWCITIENLGGGIDSVNYPSTKQVPAYNPVTAGNGLFDAKVSVGLYAYNSGYSNSNYRLRYFGEDEEFISSESFYQSIWIERDRPTIRSLLNYSSGYNYQFNYYYTTTYPSVYQAAIWVGRFGDIFPRKQISPITNTSTSIQQGVYASKTRTIHERFVVYAKKIDGKADNLYPPPLPPPKKHCCEDDMSCCQPSHSPKQDNDLAEIKKMLRELTKRVGVSEYPVKIPESFNVEYSDSGKRTEPKMTSEENLTSLLGRTLKIFDGIVGEWGVGFKIADADPSKPGDQPKFVHAPNMAELMSEMYAHIFDIWIMQYQAMHVSQRHTVESMLARKVGIQNHFLLEALIDWAGFKHKDIIKKIPFLFDINAEKFDDFVKNNEQEIQVVDFDPDDKNAQSFADDILILKRAAGVIEAVYTHKFKKGSDIPEELKKILLASAEGLKRVNDDELRTSASKEDFDQWLRDAENAFINRVGQGDLQNPYGVPYANRPRLTKIQDSLEGGQTDGD